jgi:hypothetical protein
MNLNLNLLPSEILFHIYSYTDLYFQRKFRYIIKNYTHPLKHILQKKMTTPHGYYILFNCTSCKDPAAFAFYGFVDGFITVKHYIIIDNKDSCYSEYGTQICN